MKNPCSLGTSPLPPVTVDDIARRVSGTIKGKADELVLGLCSLDEPIDSGLSFCKGIPRLNELLALKTTRLAGLLVAKDFNSTILEKLGLDYSLTLIHVSDPFKALIEISPLFYRAPTLPPGVDKQASVASSARIGSDVAIGAFVWVGENAVIGDNVTIFPHAAIYPGAQIGDRCVIHSGAVIREHCVLGTDCIIKNGAVIGADGFGYIPDSKIGLMKVPQIGITRIANTVEIGANACIDRATLGTTSIGSGSKIDNLVQVGHNTKIGQYSVICGLSGLAGSCKIGNQVVIGGAVGMKDHSTVADGCRVAGRSEVWGYLREPGTYSGVPAMPHIERLRQSAALKQLPDLLKELRKSNQVEEKD